MAWNLGFKINRLLCLTRQKVFYAKPYSQNSKPRCSNPQIKSASTVTKNQSDSKLPKRNDEHIPATITNQNNFNGINSAEVPLITSDLDTSQVQIRRKFAKSSTQNAITRPLKLPRLANPFPEPLKSLPSETVSDDEKARLMHEQVKMEARFHLQMQQEMLLKQNMQKNNTSEQETNYPSPEKENDEDSYQQPNYSQREQQNSKQQPNYRKPKDYKDLMQDDQAMKLNQQQQQMQKQQQKQQSMEAAKKVSRNQQQQQMQEQQQKKQPVAAEEIEGINSTENTAEDLDNRRPSSSQSRKRKNTRAVRCHRNSSNPRQVRKQINRQYSTSSPTIDPEFISQSETCDRLIKQLKSLYPKYQNLTIEPDIAKHKSVDNSMKKTLSYSEIKTFSCDNDNKTAEVTHKTFSWEPVNKVTPEFLYKAKSVILPPPKKPELIKMEASYPSYSEVQEKHFYGISTSSRLNINHLLLSSKTHNKRYYSTSTKDPSDVGKQAKKKPPCKNPYPPIPECDYEETARKKKEKKRKKHCPKGKKCDQENEDVETVMMVSKIKEWLNSYKPDIENIKISRSQEDIDGCKTYVVEFNELEEIKQEDPEKLLNEEQQLAPDIVETTQPIHSKGDPEKLLNEEQQLAPNIVETTQPLHSKEDPEKLLNEEQQLAPDIVETTQPLHSKEDPEKLLNEEQQFAPDIVETTQPIHSKGDPEKLLNEEQQLAPDIVETTQPIHFKSEGFIEKHVREKTDPIPDLIRNIPEFNSSEIFFFKPEMEASGKKKGKKKGSNKLREVQNKHNKLQIHQQGYKPEVKKKQTKSQTKVKPEKKIKNSKLIEVPDEHNKLHIRHIGYKLKGKKKDTKSQTKGKKSKTKISNTNNKLREVQDKHNKLQIHHKGYKPEAKKKKKPSKIIVKPKKKIKNNKLREIPDEHNKLHIHHKDYKPKNKKKSKSKFQAIAKQFEENIEDKLREIQDKLQIYHKDYKPEVKKIEDKLGIKLKDNKFDYVTRADEEIKVEEKYNNYYFSKPMAIDDEMVEEIAEQMKKEKVNRVQKQQAEAEKLKEKIQEVNKIKDYTVAEIKTKEDRVINFSDFFIPEQKENKVNIVIPRFIMKKAPQDQFYQAPSSKMLLSFLNFKDLDDFRSPKSRKGKDCYNRHIKDGCKDQIIEDEGLPIYNYILGLGNKPQFVLNPSKTNYFRNSYITPYCFNLKPKEIEMLIKRILPK